MKYSFEIRQTLLENAMEKCKMGIYIKNMEFKKDADTWAERIAAGFHVKSAFPVKNTYMYCHTLDMCFFYDINMVPTVTYAGYTQYMAKDTVALPEAFERASEVLNAMQESKRDYDNEAVVVRKLKNVAIVEVYGKAWAVYGACESDHAV